jgi:zinc/manganese transport system substrate-binding protein
LSHSGPPEFSQIRSQFRRTEYSEGEAANEVLFQLNFSIGAHGAHRSEVKEFESCFEQFVTSFFAGVLEYVLASARPWRPWCSVVTTTEDLASLTREVGGDKVEVTALAKGYQDPHFVEPKPELHPGGQPCATCSSRLAASSKSVAADAHLERAQREDSARRAGYLDASLNVKILEIPTGQITRAMGDVHPQGNPHYWLDPGNGRRIAQAIRDRLSQLSPADKAYFAQRYDDFDKRLAAAEAAWTATMAPYKGTKW